MLRRATSLRVWTPLFRRSYRPIALGAFLFSQFDSNDDSGNTREQRMLEFSIKERIRPPTTLAEQILGALDKYAWEPACILARFAQLLAIFLPVLLAIPVTLVSAKSWYRYLTWAMETAGPSFIKLGQWAASRTDIFPEAMCEYMGRLHSKAKQHSMWYTRKQILSELGKPVEELFSEFEGPIGIGAMGQVYRARLRDPKGDSAKGDAQGAEEGSDTPPSAAPVVVKVLHPGIDRTIQRDLKIMAAFANFINALPTMEWLSLPGEVDTFGVMMMSQLDLRIEAENLRIFSHNFRDRPNISFPKPYEHFTTRTVMVEELVEAVPMEDILKNARNSPVDHAIAGVGLDAFLKMLLLDNFIHADLHPGNIMVRFHKHPLDSPQGQKENSEVCEALKRDWSTWDTLGDYNLQVVFIDAGLVTELRDKERRNFIALFQAIATFNGYKAGELMVERSRTPETAIDAEVFALRTQQLVDKVKARTFALGSVKLGDLLTSMLHMVRKHHVRMESDFITVVLSILLLEGIGRQLDPNLDIFKAAIPILREVGQQGDLPIALNEETLQMLKVWLVLEARQFVSASIKDVHRCVKYDLLSPNC